MQLNLVSWNGNALSTNYYGWVVYPKPMRQIATANFLEVAGTYPTYTGKSFQNGGYLTIQIRYEDALANVHLREAEITRWFSTADATPHMLLASDSSDSNRQWYVMATPVSIMQENNSAIIVLALDTPYWQVYTLSTATWNIAASTASTSITCLGETAAPVFAITPTTPKAAGYLYRRFVEIMPPSTIKTLSNYPVNLGPLNTAALVAGAKAQASGNDFRVNVDGSQVDRWFGAAGAAFNTAITNIWTVLTFKPAINLTLGTAITIGGAVTTIQFDVTTANKAAVTSLPSSGIIKITTGANIEYFTYTSKNALKASVSGVTRAAKLSTAAAHSVGDACAWVQHSVFILYGNAAVGAPTISDASKPMFDLDSSTNSSWVYTSFLEAGQPRAGRWNKALISSTLKKSAPYTGSHGATADPATEAGLLMATKKVNGVQKAETASLNWSLNCPAGITTIASMTVDRYRALADYPDVYLKKSMNGVTFTNAQTITQPSAKITWQTQTITGLALGASYPYIKFSMSGTLVKGAGNAAYAEITGCTLTIDGSSIPVVTMKAEDTTYNLQAKITNATTGESIDIDFSMKLNATLTIDCSTRSITYSDGSKAQSAADLDSERVDWLNLAYGANSIQWSDTGTLGVTVGITWRDLVAL